MNIPAWWLVVSGVFFVVAIVMAVALTVLAYQLTITVRRLQIQIDALTRRADEIGSEVRAIARRVNQITHSAGDRADRFGGAVDLVASQMAGRSQWISAGLTVFSLLRAVWRGRRRG